MKTLQLLRESAAKFRQYEALHRAKGTAESTAKAEVNAEIAGRIEAYLAGAGETERSALQQQQCVDWGAYWRAPDAHGVELTTEQATELLRRALGVEVEIKQNDAPIETEEQGYALEAVGQWLPELATREDNLTVLTPAQLERLLRALSWHAPCDARKGRVPAVVERGERAAAFDAIVEACGHVEDGSSEAAWLGQDEATKEWILGVGKKAWYGRSPLAAVAAMKKDSA